MQAINIECVSLNRMVRRYGYRLCSPPWRERHGYIRSSIRDFSFIALGPRRFGCVTGSVRERLR
jgi:hypothetical protein